MENGMKIQHTGDQYSRKREQEKWGRDNTQSDNIRVNFEELMNDSESSIPSKMNLFLSY